MVVQTENDLIAFVDRLWRKYQVRINVELEKDNPDLKRVRFLLEAQEVLMDSLREVNELDIAETLKGRK